MPRFFIARSRLVIVSLALGAGLAVGLLMIGNAAGNASSRVSRRYRAASTFLASAPHPSAATERALERLYPQLDSLLARTQLGSAKTRDRRSAAVHHSSPANIPAAVQRLVAARFPSDRKSVV